ncbi:hypothetical protein FPE01S_01_13730 [Flavihumibacter petaseus NBRC 106054]|uniref:DUF4595 domain-containing protein n=2 Tax=Flavihumibacter TaxID=1004301 RepID=A0A0E9MXN6_9BACT|nr:hypothetical protein FPE01S_01_13730 [Flavihumibacter petaseus NBRC 106054]
MEGQDMNFTYENGRLASFTLFESKATNHVFYREDGKIDHIAFMDTAWYSDFRTEGSSVIFSYDQQGRPVKANYKLPKQLNDINSPYFGDLSGNLRNIYDSIAYTPDDKIAAVYTIDGDSSRPYRYATLDYTPYADGTDLSMTLYEWAGRNQFDVLETIRVKLTDVPNPYHALWFFPFIGIANWTNQTGAGTGYLPMVFNDTAGSLVKYLVFSKTCIFNYEYKLRYTFSTYGESGFTYKYNSDSTLLKVGTTGFTFAWSDIKLTGK